MHEGNRPMNEGLCWAQSVGNCGGPITREHLVTQALYTGPVSVKTRLFGSGPAAVSAGRHTANILCRDHNNELGRTADAAALKLYRHLTASNRPTSLRGSPSPRPPIERRVAGTSFGRWLCKTHCNMMVAHGLTPDAAYIRYAFLLKPGKRVYMYLAVAVGETVTFADVSNPLVGWRQLVLDDHPKVDAFTLEIGGLEWAVSTEPMLRSGQPMPDRVNLLSIPTPLGPFRISFDWSEEPGVL